MTSTARLAVAGLCYAALAGCTVIGTGGTTEMQVMDRDAFASAHTYRLVPPPDTVAAPLRQTIEENINATLTRKGYRRVDGDGPVDLRVQYRAAAVGRVERDADPAPPVSQLTTVGGNDAATGYQPLAGSAISATVGRLVVYVNDDKTGRAIWQGTTEAETVGSGMARSTAGREAARLLRDVPKAAP